ncbi:hypothetical protein APE01nite_00400 [Acetobacter peroxydans]|uniref:Uncharacterized protein n=1 Tax=Acetobacter peroxydans TaxID=104098 RepID=A0A4Y3TR78_9PROT|nr:hypothetical protein APE01nite_00400 [Acetobacter peroxydans]
MGRPGLLRPRCKVDQQSFGAADIACYHDVQHAHGTCGRCHGRGLAAAHGRDLAKPDPAELLAMK